MLIRVLYLICLSCQAIVLGYSGSAGDPFKDLFEIFTD